MSLIKCFFLLPLFIGCWVYCQEPKKTDKNYLRYIDSAYSSNPKVAILKLEEYLTELQKENNKDHFHLNKIYQYLALNCWYNNDFEKVKYYSKKGLLTTSYGGITNGRATYFGYLGNIFAMENKLDSAAYFYIKQIKAYEDQGKQHVIPGVFNNVGLVYKSQKDFNKAITYFSKAYHNLDKKYDEFKSLIAGNLSYCYFEVDSLEKANYYSNRSIEIEKNNPLLHGGAQAYLTKHKISERNKNRDSASYYGFKALQLAEKEGDSLDIAMVSTNLAKFILHENPLKSIDYATTAFNIYRNLNYSLEIQDATKVLSDAYYNSKDYKNASYFQRKYILYQDSLLKENYNKNSIDIFEKYETAQKELKIKEQRLELTKKENQKRTYSIIAASLAAIALLLIVLFIQNRKTQKQKIVNLEKEKENIELRSLMAGEEKERSRIAKELHDGIGSLLAASKMHASKLHADNSESNQTLLTLLDNASKETRRISHNLLPESLMNKGLDVALQDFISSINESQLLKADYQSINLSSTLPQSLQLSIYRIVQELINNIIKHSEATQALVQLNQNKNKLIITVEDNGKGFAFDTSNKGIGLQNIESRLSLLNGKIEVDSRDALGTSVYIEFELEK